MKKTIAFISAVLALAACAKTEIQEPAQAGSKLTFVGTTMGTKIAAGEKVNGVYKAVWEEGDVLSIVGTDGAPLGTATLVDGIGQNIGMFESSATIADGTQVSLVYGDGKPAAAQTQANAKSAHLVASGSSDVVTVTSAEPVQFKLNHNLAYVKVELATSTLADYTLEKVMLYSKNSVINSDEDDTDYVEVSFTEKSTLASGAEAWLTCLPMETRAADFYVVVTLKKDGTTVTIPMLYERKALASGKVTTIKVADLGIASNSCPWYEPVETRALDGGWAYGDANTLICPPPASRTRLNYPVKARGNFRKVQEPKYAQVGAKRFFDLNVDHKWTWVDGKNDAAVALTDAILPLDYQIGHTTYKEGGIGQVNILGADMSIIWTVNVWYVGDLGTVDYAAGKLCDHNLGCGYPVSYDNWKAQGVYFQYGRTSYSTWSDKGNDETIPASEVEDPLEVAIKVPTSRVMKSQTVRWEVDGQKSIYDPCPKGYKVASADILKEAIAEGVAAKRTNLYAISLTKGGKTDYWVANSVFAADATGNRQGGNAYFSYWSADASYNIYFKNSQAVTDNAPAAGKTRAMGVRCMVDDARL